MGSSLPARLFYFPGPDTYTGQDLVELHMLKDYKTRVTGNYEILRALLEVAGIAGKSVSCFDVGFRIGPRINAVGRMAGASAAGFCGWRSAGLGTGGGAGPAGVSGLL